MLIAQLKIIQGLGPGLLIHPGFKIIPVGLMIGPGIGQVCLPLMTGICEPGLGIDEIVLLMDVKTGIVLESLQIIAHPAVLQVGKDGQVTG
jgi:hypothetical protein